MSQADFATEEVYMCVINNKSKREGERGRAIEKEIAE